MNQVTMIRQEAAAAAAAAHISPQSPLLLVSLYHANPATPYLVLSLFLSCHCVIKYNLALKLSQGLFSKDTD